MCNPTHQASRSSQADSQSACHVPSKLALTSPCMRICICDCVQICTMSLTLSPLPLSHRPFLSLSLSSLSHTHSMCGPPGEATGSRTLDYWECPLDWNNDIGRCLSKSIRKGITIAVEKQKTLVLPVMLSQKSACRTFINQTTGKSVFSIPNL